jgi:hypothetical protein
VSTNRRRWGTRRGVGKSKYEVYVVQGESKISRCMVTVRDLRIKRTQRSE